MNPVLIHKDTHYDNRGWFRELHRGDGEFKQDNISFSKRGVIRGLHFQTKNPQGKLVIPIEGVINDVVVDIQLFRYRDGKVAIPETFGTWKSYTLDAHRGDSLYVPPGFAHGFQALTDALVMYKCTELREQDYEYVLSYNDPTLGIQWEPGGILSERDQKGLRLEEIVSLAYEDNYATAYPLTALSV